jgi:RNA polymerase sigma factor (sigma-70 family)
MLMDELEDAKLLEKFRLPESRHCAFNELVCKYQKRLYWHVRRMILDHDDSNDVIQNVFIKVWQSLDNFRSDAQLYTWLYRIATNETITFLNKKKKRALISFSNLEHEMADKLHNDPLFTGDKIQLKLQKAILTLPPQQRLIFNMKYFEDLKYEQISEILGVSVGGLKASYHHAVKKIEKFILND